MAADHEVRWRRRQSRMAIAYYGNGNRVDKYVFLMDLGSRFKLQWDSRIIVAASEVEKERSIRLSKATLNQVFHEALAFKLSPRTRGDLWFCGDVFIAKTCPVAKENGPGQASRYTQSDHRIHSTSFGHNETGVTDQVYFQFQMTLPNRVVIETPVDEEQTKILKVNATEKKSLDGPSSSLGMTQDKSEAQRTDNIKNQQLQDLKSFDLVFFPILEGNHFYVIVFEFKNPAIYLLDNMHLEALYDVIPSTVEEPKSRTFVDGKHSSTTVGMSYNR
ncbi:hypothetical protein R6Q59_028045 [Mikania micrantha]